MSLFSRARAYADRAPLRFHTPGHKGRLDPLDLTEIPGAFPLDRVEAAERKAAAAYGVPRLRFLVNGSSAGIKAAILSAPGDLLAENVSHRAVAEGAELAGKRLHRLNRRLSEGLYLPPTAGEVLSAAREAGVGTVLLTSPDYYGRVVDRSVFAAVRAAGLTLIVDGAHGAHFAFSPLFPPSPAPLADMCNLSAHKTMRAYTQSAYLAIGNEAYTAPVDHALTLLGTTSPSYLLLGGLESAVEYALENAGRYETLFSAVCQLKKKFVTAPNDDFTRLVLDCGYYGKSGGDVYAALLNKGAAAEAFDGRYVIFIVTLDDTPAEIDALARLWKEVLT